MFKPTDKAVYDLILFLRQQSASEKGQEQQKSTYSNVKKDPQVKCNSILCSVDRVTMMAFGKVNEHFTS